MVLIFQFILYLWIYGHIGMYLLAVRGWEGDADGEAVCAFQGWQPLWELCSTVAGLEVRGLLIVWAVGGPERMREMAVMLIKDSLVTPNGHHEAQEMEEIGF